MSNVRRGNKTNPSEGSTWCMIESLLINVAQPLALGIQDLMDRSIPEDPIRWHRVIRLQHIRISCNPSLGWVEQIAHAQKRRSTSWVLFIQTRLGVSVHGSSAEGPEILRVRILPVVPDLVNHLQGNAEVRLESLTIAMKINNLTA